MNVPAPVPPRAVVFMTAACPRDVPAQPHAPACVLPLGAATFAERVLEACAAAGLRQVDLVLSDAPEAVRRVLQDGWRWGLALRWHLAKDSVTPYGVLHTLGLAAGERVVVGHGHRWLDAGHVAALCAHDQVAMHAGDALAWTGWASFDASLLRSISPHVDFEALGALLATLHARQCRVVGDAGFASASGARDLLHAQAVAWGEAGERFVPATWVRMPWGAMSPDAHVHAGAQVQGPALVGPGCMVDAGARLGPGVVLSQDVYVAGGAELRNVLVLPDTYIGGAVQLEGSVVRGNSVQDLRWGALAVVPASDALMGALRQERRTGPGPGARVLAAVLALATALPCALLAGVQALDDLPPWRPVEAVLGRCAETGRLLTCRVREPASPGWAGRTLGAWGALLDIAQGRRNWLGVRPREHAQWFALRRDWQQLFEGQVPGWLHAPAWVDGAAAADTEALAAADAWLAVRRGWRDRLATFRALARIRLTAGAAR